MHRLRSLRQRDCRSRCRLARRSRRQHPGAGGRRFIAPATVEGLARVVVAGGELRIATDAPLYARWALAHVLASGVFNWTARRPSDWRTPPADWVATRYQRRAEKAARDPIYLSFLRSGPGGGR